MAQRHTGEMKMVKGKAPNVPSQRGFRPDRLKEMRLRRGLTQTELAQRAGVTKRQIIRWEKGENEPDAWSIGRLAKALDVTSDWFLGLTEKSQNHYSEQELSAEERKIVFAFRKQDAAAFIEIIGKWLKKRLDSDGDLTDTD